MTIKNAGQCEDLRSWLKSPAIGLSEYSADLTVQRRVGRMLATSNAKFLSEAQKNQ